MGTDSKDDITLYLNGAAIAQDIYQLPEIALPVDTADTESLSLCEPAEFTMTIKIPKRWRCRGRKRFVKLMMSEGLSRD